MNKTYLQASITLDAALVIAKAAIDKGNELGIRMNAVVVDIAGNRLVSLREPGAPMPAMDFAEKKAYTAANFRTPTEKWADILDGRPIVANGLAQHEKVALFGGGLPILIDGVVVGAIGVSGGKVPDDILCAEAGLEALSSLT